MTFEDIEDGVPEVSPTISYLDKPVYLPSTSTGRTSVVVFDSKSTALRLITALKNRHLTFCALGADGQVSVMAVGWKKLLVYDSFCPYLQRLFQAYTPVYMADTTWFVSRVTYEAETLANALRTVGLRLKANSVVYNSDLRSANIHMCIVDEDYVPVTGSASELPSAGSSLN